MPDVEPKKGKWYGEIRFDGWSNDGDRALLTQDDGSLGQWFEMSRDELLDYLEKHEAK